MVWVEGTIVFNFTKGSFGLNSNWFIIKGSFMQWWKSQDSKNPIFRFCYPWICKFRYKGVLPSDYGSEDHHLHVWMSLPKSELWVSCGTGLKLSRWMAWGVKCRHASPFFGEWMLAFIVLGLFEGFYHSLTDLPFAASSVEAKILAGDWDMKDAEVPDAAPDEDELGLDCVPEAAGPAPAAKVPVKGNLDGAEVLCKHKKRNAQLCMQICTRPLTLRAMIAMRAFAEPIEFEHHDTFTKIKIPEEIEKIVSDMAKKGYNRYLFEIIDKLRDGPLMDELLFEDTCESEDTSEISEDQQLGKICFDLVRNLFSQELGAMRYRSCRPPMRFTLLFGESDEVMKDTLRWCADLQSALYKLEALAVHDTFFKTFLRDMMWPSNPHVREILVALEETGFQSLPRDVIGEIDILKTGQNGTPMCEETFRHFNACAKHSPAGTLSRTSRWHRELTGPIPAAYNRQLPIIDPKANFTKAKKLDPSVFDYTKVDQSKHFSLGHDLLETIASKDLRDFPTCV